MALEAACSVAVVETITESSLAVCRLIVAVVDVVTLNVTGAGRDPAAFPEPDRFDLYRPEPHFDIGFGYGAHYCLGLAVAKAEMEEGLKVLTRRWRDVTIDGAIEIAAGGVIAGPEVIPLHYRTV